MLLFPIIGTLVFILFPFLRLKPDHTRRCGQRHPARPAFHRTPLKPPWVRREILRLKARMPEAGCRCLARVFNRRHAHRGMTVSKTYVSDLIRRNQYEIAVLRKNLKKQKPRTVPHNLVWALDLTGKRDAAGRDHALLGVLEHRSRACLSLQALADKSSLALLRRLLDLIERYGRPRCLRTDNEGVFTSRLFRFGLFWLGIQHQRTDPACPWQNGRIERFFGTLKNKLDRWQVADGAELARALHLFRLWYNHVRPHSAHGEFTPVEVWRDQTAYRRGQPLWFEAWDGLLTGDYWPS